MNNEQAKMMLPKWLTWKRLGIYLGIIIVLDFVLIAYMVGIDAIRIVDPSDKSWSLKDAKIAKTICGSLILASFIYPFIWVFLRKRKLRKLKRGEI